MSLPVSLRRALAVIMVVALAACSSNSGDLSDGGITTQADASSAHDGGTADAVPTAVDARAFALEPLAHANANCPTFSAQAATVGGAGTVCAISAFDDHDCRQGMSSRCDLRLGNQTEQVP